MVERIKPQAQPFKLQEVRLGESPFQHAMQMNARYLLMLEPDRLLHRFRLYARLQPKAPVYGDWESMGVSGHTLGHYLSAGAPSAIHRLLAGRFFDVSYPLPQSLTAGKERITVRFQAHPGRLAGGVFGLRILRPEEHQ